jgi:hypothetical protein
MFVLNASFIQRMCYKAIEYFIEADTRAIIHVSSEPNPKELVSLFDEG